MSGLQIKTLTEAVDKPDASVGGPIVGERCI